MALPVRSPTIYLLNAHILLLLEFCQNITFCEERDLHRLHSMHKYIDTSFFPSILFFDSPSQRGPAITCLCNSVFTYSYYSEFVFPQEFLMLQVLTFVFVHGLLNFPVCSPSDSFLAYLLE